MSSSDHQTIVDNLQDASIEIQLSAIQRLLQNFVFGLNSKFLHFLHSSHDSYSDFERTLVFKTAKFLLSIIDLDYSTFSNAFRSFIEVMDLLFHQRDAYEKVTEKNEELQIEIKSFEEQFVWLKKMRFNLEEENQNLRETFEAKERKLKHQLMKISLAKTCIDQKLEETKKILKFENTRNWNLKGLIGKLEVQKRELKTSKRVLKKASNALKTSLHQKRNSENQGRICPGAARRGARRNLCFSKPRPCDPRKMNLMRYVCKKMFKEATVELKRSKREMEAIKANDSLFVIDTQKTSVEE
ncbi:hypothetical protein L596_021796 [Steinernema carpocapsae]|uniref:Uncharacterized protein n=1 Tax=Steinernema carpocapsae TaxID=34508 RepID=A0A4V6XVW7_STECR|nr:hypothetical protein L596_021796 [Steinernema carpocapsae]